jgi:hypothetical protein
MSTHGAFRGADRPGEQPVRRLRPHPRAPFDVSGERRRVLPVARRERLRRLAPTARRRTPGEQQDSRYGDKRTLHTAQYGLKIGAGSRVPPFPIPSGDTGGVPAPGTASGCVT